MARRPARHDGAVDRQSALRAVCAPHLNRQRSMTNGFKTAKPGKSDSPLCRMRRKRATSSSPTTRSASSSPPPIALDDKFGLLTDTLAITGARPSQAVRLRVEDLHDHPVRPKLMMPKSAKGGGRKSQREEDRALFGADHRAAGGQAERGGSEARPDHAPLLLQGDGSPWPDNPGASYHREVEQGRRRHRRSILPR